MAIVMLAKVHRQKQVPYTHKNCCLLETELAQP